MTDGDGGGSYRNINISGGNIQLGNTYSSRQSQEAKRHLDNPPVNDGPWFLIPYSRNAVFVGRTSILGVLNEWLGSPAENRRRGVHRRAALHGLGGIGKTQVALQWAYDLREKQPELSVFWVHASTSERFIDGYTSIAKTCDITDCEPGDPQLLNKVKTWLASNQQKQPWLMVVDNADDIEVFYEKRPFRKLKDRMGKYIPDTPNGSVLFTTRNLVAAVDLAPLQDPLLVTAPSAGECVDIMRNRLPAGKYEEEDLRRLAKELEYLPLAMVQATAYLKKTSRLVSWYLEQLQKSGDDGLIDMLEHEFRDLGRDEGRDDRVPNAVARTWLVSFQTIKKERPFAIELLNLTGCFDRQDIPGSFFECYVDNYSWLNNTLFKKKLRSYRDNRNGESSRNKAGKSERWGERMKRLLLPLRVGSITSNGKSTRSPQSQSPPSHKADAYEGKGERPRTPTIADMDDALSLLKAYSFLTEGHGKLFTLHRLVHLVVQKQMKSSGQSAEIATKSMANICLMFPHPNESENWNQIRSLMPHVNAVLRQGPMRMDCYEAAFEKVELLTRVSMYLGYQGEPLDRIRPLIEEAIELSKQIGDEGNVVHTKTNLTAILLQRGEAAEAMEILEALLPSAKKSLGARHDTTLFAMQAAAECYLDMDRVDEGARVLDEVVDARVEEDGESGEVTFWTLADRARAFGVQGRLEDGVALARWLLYLKGKVRQRTSYQSTLIARDLFASTGRDEETLPLAHAYWQLASDMFGERHSQTLWAAWRLRQAKKCKSRGRPVKEAFPYATDFAAAAEKWKAGYSNPPPSTSRFVQQILDEYRQGQENLDELAEDDWRRSWAWTHYPVYKYAMRGYDWQQKYDEAWAAEQDWTDEGEDGKDRID